MDGIEDIYRELSGRAWLHSRFPLAENFDLETPQHPVRIRPVMGHPLLASKVHALVSAMASFTPPAVGQTLQAESFQPWNSPMFAADGGA